jgi:hypothetical protein
MAYYSARFLLMKCNPEFPGHYLLKMPWLFSLLSVVIYRNHTSVIRRSIITVIDTASLNILQTNKKKETIFSPMWKKLFIHQVISGTAICDLRIVKAIDILVLVSFISYQLHICSRSKLHLYIYVLVLSKCKRMQILLLCRLHESTENSFKTSFHGTIKDENKLIHKRFPITDFIHSLYKI